MHKVVKMCPEYIKTWPFLKNAALKYTLFTAAVCSEEHCKHCPTLHRRKFGKIKARRHLFVRPIAVGVRVQSGKA